MAEDPRGNTGRVFENRETGEQFFVDQGGELQPLPEVGPAQALLTSTGTGVLKAPLQFGTGIAELGERALGAAGLDVGTRTSDILKDATRQIGQRDTQLKASLRQPGTSFGGELLGNVAAFPGRRLAQAVFGTGQAVGIGETPGQELFGVGLNALGVGVGQLAGRQLQRQGSNRLRATSAAEDEAQRAQAFLRLNAKGAPMSRGDAASLGARGNPARAADVRRTTQTGESAVNELGKRRFLNSEVLKPLGRGNKNNVSDDVRQAIDQDIDKLYQGIRDDIPNALEPAKFEQLNDWSSGYIAKFRPEEPRAAGLMDDLAADTAAGRMDGKRYLQWRKDLGKAARGTEDVFARELYYGAINQLDAIFESSAGVRNKLIIANQSWRYNEVLNAPGVVSPQGNVNAQGFVRNMERMFGDIRFGTGPNQMSQAFRTVRDAQQFPGFRDSGTARRGLQPGLFRTAINQFKGEAGEIVGAGLGRQLTPTVLGPSILDESEDETQRAADIERESDLFFPN